MKDLKFKIIRLDSRSKFCGTVLDNLMFDHASRLCETLNTPPTSMNYAYNVVPQDFIA